MKKILLCVFIQVALYFTSNAQITYPGSFIDDYFFELPSNLKSAATTQYSPYGAAFTPKGDFKVLIICAGFGNPCDNYSMPGWATGINTFPDWVNNKATFYSNNSDFNNPATTNDRGNVSRFYYEMSKGTFKLTADVYPTRVNIDATGATSFGDLNRKVIEKMKVDNPTFDWSKYDKRKNSPNYSTDNSTSSPDNIADFVVIVYRYQREVNDKNSPWYIAPPVPDDPSTPNYNEAMYNWQGSGGGYAAIDGLSGVIYNGYSFGSSCGYTQGLGSSDMYGLFIHEVGHTLFHCPHYANANGVAGDYFYNQIGGWGMMNLGSGSFGCAIGWERWYLGWLELTSNGINSDVKSSTDLPNYGEFTLRDFITTGDVVRIKLPNGTGTNQYLWLENHQGKSIFDDRGWGTTDGCRTFPTSARGLVAYVESIAGDRSIVYVVSSGKNGIKPLHSHGYFDYSYFGTPSTQCLWGNPVYNITEGASNPVSGQSKIEGLRFDFNGDGQIYVNNDYNNPKPGNEYHWVAKQNNVMSYDFMGGDINFSVGKTLGMTTNPMLTNRPMLINTSDATKETLTPIYLNGISVTVYSQASNGDIKVRISFNNTAVTTNLCWTGNIILPDITGNTSPDLNLYPNYTLTINKSGTPNRHTKTTFGDFINPSIFTCAQNSYFKMQSNSKTIVDNYSTLVLESGSTYEINDGAVLTIKNGSSFQVKTGANLTVKGSGRVEIESGAYICIETGANINLQDYLSVINLHTGYQTGLNPALYASSASCSSTPLTFVITGNGSINSYSANNYIQNQTFSINDFLTGFNIFAGTNVTAAKPQGLVIIQNGANVVFDADGEILLDKGFEVQLGATFEAK